VTTASGAGLAGQRTERLTVLDVMLRSAEYLAGKGIESARLDAEHLFAHALGVGRLQMYLQHERLIEDAELERFRPLLKRRGTREPLQYILGRQGFRELDLEVGPGVLIPRPETERLVEAVLEWSKGQSEIMALDVGTGTGAIALSLLTEGPFAGAVGTDISPDALAYATRNRAEAGLDSRLELRQGRLFEPVGPEERFDVVVSNPPYVPEVDREGLQTEVGRWEPEAALFAGDDGLAILRELVPAAASVLRPGGLLAMEVGDGQAQRVVGLVNETDAYGDATIHRDLAGRERIVTAMRHSGKGG
jgi:release factor glutamine methyltransferase